MFWCASAERFALFIMVCRSSEFTDWKGNNRDKAKNCCVMNKFRNLLLYCTIIDLYIHLLQT